jgi:AraC-like DNA-binding protein
MNEDTVSAKSDLLSSVLMTMKLKTFINLAIDAGGAWAIDFPPLDGLSLNVVQKGEGWLTVGRQKVRLRAGDCFLLTGRRAFSLSKNLSNKTPVRAEQLFRNVKNGVATCHGGGDFYVVGTLFRFEGHLPALVFGRLPPVIHIPGDSDAAAVLRWSTERFTAELRGTSVGRTLILSHLAPIMLLQTLRLYLASATGDDNWLAALLDPRIARVVEAAQNDVKRAWSLESFARLAGMSRSGFALAFKKKVGVAPMDYLTNWRMQVACELLQTTDDSLASIASAVGYASESAFSVAFNKIVKRRPGAYRKQFAA